MKSKRDWKQYYKEHRDKILARMREYNKTDKYKQYYKKYRESHKKYYRDYMSVYNEHHLGSKSTEKIYTSKNLQIDSEILHNEANKIRNYKKHKLNEDNDYNKRDYLFNHIYYSDDYETVVTDNYDSNT